MILKQPSRPRSRPARRPVTAGRVALVAASAMALVALGAALADHAALAARQVRWMLRPPEAAAASTAPVATDRLYLRLEWNDMAQLERQRREALDAGVLFAGRDDFVPAWIGLNDPKRQLLKAKVRLKGDWTEHLEGDRWSLRVKLKGDGRLFGMKTLSLQLPERRNGIHEWIFHQAMRREGLVSLRYRFVRLILNGTDLGIYAVEEHFDSRLLEDNRRRAGPILSFDESLFWEIEAGRGRATPGLAPETMADIRSMSRAQIERPGPEREAFLHAASLLAGLRSGELAPAEVFDVGKIALHYALSDLLGGHHGLAWINLRFYFNPLTARLEPIGFDADAGQKLSETAFHQPAGLRRLWRDDDFVRAYLAALERLAQPAYLDALFADVGAELRRNEAILAGRTSGAARLATLSPREVYAANQAVLRAFLRPSRAVRPHLAAISPERLEIDVVSYVRLPLEVVALKRRGQAPLTPATAAVVEPYAPGPVRLERVAFEVPAAARGAWTDASGAELEYRVAGTSSVASEPLIPWPAPQPRRIAADLLRDVPAPGTAELAALPFLLVEAGSQQVRILPGEWTLSRSLVIPPGLVLVAGPGTTLDLDDGAAVLSYSPLELRGRPEEPIVIRATGGTGQGLVVINAGPSTLEHVRFAGLAAPRGAGWAFTGAVTFYQSPVTLRAVDFVANRDSDDALNVVRGDFTLTEGRFLDTPGDAIDVDFGSGTVAGCRFERIGGDGIDTSGSTLTLTRLVLTDVGDKALSVGEASRVRFQDLTIERSALALVSKDDSELSGHGVVLRDCGVGFAAFRKKPELGPASLDVGDYQATGVTTLYQLEPGSQLILDAQPMAANASHLREQFYSDEPQFYSDEPGSGG